tara:strand:+ start:772 stop:1098 length:327 start_codon:yes stop_codon:yes gene_type:complete
MERIIIQSLQNLINVYKLELNPEEQKKDYNIIHNLKTIINKYGRKPIGYQVIIIVNDNETHSYAPIFITSAEARFWVNRKNKENWKNYEIAPLYSVNEEYIYHNYFLE